MNKKGVVAPIATILIVAAVLVIVYGIVQNVNHSERVKLETNYGDIVVELYDDMPITTSNFKLLVESGFYDGILFHRIVAGFVIQGGDPLTKDPEKEALWGTGGSEAIPDEFNDESNVKYSVAMANAGPDTGSSQFFINLQDNVLLDGRHPVFGEVVEGKEVVDAIGLVATNEKGVPNEDVVIIKASVLNSENVLNETENDSDKSVSIEIEAKGF